MSNFSSYLSKFLVLFSIFILQTPQATLALECIEQQQECIEGPQTRIEDDMPIHRDCWKYQYVKECKVNSDNDCHKIDSNICNFAKDNCLEKTTFGMREFCLNTQKEYHCAWDEEYEITTPELIIDPDNKKAATELICKAFCIDGNCKEAYKDKSQDNDEVANSIAQLEMLKGIRNGLVDENGPIFNIFSANQRNCSTKKTGYTKCCSDSGWAKSIGLSSCSADEKKLAEEWKKGKCEYVDEYCADKEGGPCWVRKKVYCCFPTILAKTIRLAGKTQLGKGFGGGKNVNCGGLTIEELESIDFAKVDFKEFFDREVIPQMKDYNPKESEDLMKRSFENIEKNSTNGANKTKLESEER